MGVSIGMKVRPSGETTKAFRRCNGAGSAEHKPSLIAKCMQKNARNYLSGLAEAADRQVFPHCQGAAI
jgi:hypothetical protein